MSFKDMKRPELLKVAEEFGVEVPSGNFVKNEKIVELLEADGVTYDQWQRLNNDVEEDVQLPEAPKEVKVKDVTNSVLLKMTRENGTFEDRGYRFTKSHPFVAVAEEDADFFVTQYEGFRIALPSEVKDYYS